MFFDDEPRKSESRSKANSRVKLFWAIGNFIFYGRLTCCTHFPKTSAIHGKVLSKAQYGPVFKVIFCACVYLTLHRRLLLKARCCL